MKIAKFKSLEHGFDSVSDEGLDDVDGYVRITVVYTETDEKTHQET